MKVKLHAELIFICLTFFETEAQENSEMAHFAGNFFCNTEHGVKYAKE